MLGPVKSAPCTELADSQSVAVRPQECVERACGVLERRERLEAPVLSSLHRLHLGFGIPTWVQTFVSCRPEELRVRSPRKSWNRPNF